MRSLPAWIDNEISLVSKWDCLLCGRIDLKNNASVGEALDRMASAERSLMLEVRIDERSDWIKWNVLHAKRFTSYSKKNRNIHIRILQLQIIFFVFFPCPLFIKVFNLKTERKHTVKAKTYLLRHQLCKFLYLKRWERSAILFIGISPLWETK